MRETPGPAALATRRLWALLAVLVLFALGVRALGSRRTFHNGHVFLFGNDSWCHMRRVVYAMGHGLRLPEPDPYLNFPDGGATLWGGSFDRGVALAALAAGGRGWDRHKLEAFVSWIPPLLGALCVIPMFLIARRLYGDAAGIFSALALAILPGHVQYSLLGNLDHHVLESLLFGATSCAFLHLRGGEGAGRAGPNILGCGILLWLLFLTHPALACLYAGVLWLCALCQAWKGPLSPGFFWAFLLPALLLLPLAPASLSGAAGVSRISSAPAALMYERYSFLQPALLAFFAAGLRLLQELRGIRAPDAAGAGVQTQSRELRVAGLALAAGACGVLLGWPVLAGLGELFKQDPWLKYIAETRPILSPSPESFFNTRFALAALTALFPLFPLWWLWSWRGRKDLFLAIWSIALFILVNVQLRFVILFAYAMALAIGTALAWAWESLRGPAAGAAREPFSIRAVPAALGPAAGAARSSSGYPPVGRARAAALAAVLLAGLWPSLSWLYSLSRGSRFRYLTLSDAQYEMLLALKENSPPTRGYADADRQPEYAVLAPWDLGHAIVYLAERAVVADPFGHGVRRSALYYAARTPSEALAALEGVRYVVTQDMSSPLIGRIYADYLGLPAEHALRKGDWQGLFQMRMLLDLPVLDDKGRRSRWGHEMVWRSEQGDESLYAFDPASLPPGSAVGSAREPFSIRAVPAALGPAAGSAREPFSTRAAAKGPQPPSRPETNRPSKPLAPASPPAAPAERSAPLPPALAPVPAAPVPTPSPSPAPASQLPSGGPFIARAGEDEFVVTPEDIADYQAAQRCYPEGLDSRKAAFMRQLEPVVMTRILAKEGGIRISEEALRKEEERVDKETRAPDILACIKNHFGGRKDAYRRVYLRPILAQKEFFRWLNYDRKVQARAYGLADKVAVEVKKESFQAVASRYSMTYASSTYTMQAPAQAASPGAGPGGGPGMGWSPFEPYFIEQNLKDLSPGQARKEPVDGDADLLFVRLIEKDGGRWRFETIRIQKTAINEFMKSRPKVPFQVLDPDLEAWLKGITGNPLLWGLEWR